MSDNASQDRDNIINRLGQVSNRLNHLDRTLQNFSNNLAHQLNQTVREVNQVTTSALVAERQSVRSYIDKLGEQLKQTVVGKDKVGGGKVSNSDINAVVTQMQRNADKVMSALEEYLSNHPNTNRRQVGFTNNWLNPSNLQNVMTESLKNIVMNVENMRTRSLYENMASRSTSTKDVTGYTIDKANEVATTSHIEIGNDGNAFITDEAQHIILSSSKELAKAMQRRASAIDDGIQIEKQSINELKQSTSELVDSMSRNSAFLDSLSQTIRDTEVQARRYRDRLDVAVQVARSIDLNTPFSRLQQEANALCMELARMRKDVRHTSSNIGNVSSQLSGALSSGANKVQPRSKKSSFQAQEKRNAELGKQKSFLALLIPALAKLLKKTPIWDVLKLLLLKFGKNHPIAAGIGLTAGPAGIAGLLTNALMGNPIGKMFARGAGVAKGAVGTQLSGAGKQILQGGKSLVFSMKSSFGKFTDGLKTFIDNQKRIHSIEKRMKTASKGLEKHGNIVAQFARNKVHPTNVKDARKMYAAFPVKYTHDILKASESAEQFGRYSNVYNSLSSRRRQLMPVRSKISDLVAGGKYNMAVAKNRFGNFVASQKVAYAINPQTYVINIYKTIVDGVSKAVKGSISTLKVGFVNSFKIIGDSLKSTGKLLKNPATYLNTAKTGIRAVFNPMSIFKGMGQFKLPKLLGGNTLKGTWARGLIKSGGVKGALKGVPGLSALSEVLFDIPALIKSKKQGGGAFGKQVAKTGGGAVGSIVGGILGSALGPLGTVVGSMIGAWVGRIFGGGFGKHMSAIGDNLKGVFGSIINICRSLAPAFGLIGKVIGGLLKPVRVFVGALGWLFGAFWKVVTGIWKSIAKFVEPLAEKFGNFCQAIASGLDNMFADLRDEKKHPLVAKLFKIADKLSGDDEKEAEETDGKSIGNGSKSATSSLPSNNKNTAPSGTTGSPNNAVKKSAEGYKDITTGGKYRQYDVNGVRSARMADLGLSGKIGGGNSVPYIAYGNVDKLKSMDSYLASKGYKFTYTSAMGGGHAGGTRSHGMGQKVDLVLDNGQQLRPEDVEWLKRNGHIGNGAVGWHNAGSGYHYDLSVMNGSANKDVMYGTNGKTAVANATETAEAYKKQIEMLTSDGIRSGLAGLVGADTQKNTNRTRNLIFSVTDVTGSLGVWGITQYQNSGKRGSAV